MDKLRLERQRRYQASPKGKAARRRAYMKYNASRKGKLARREYARSCKGLEGQRLRRDPAH